ncbi:uncharacterized protein [Fopius arisanus]|uniref:Vitellogenin domain-containing protein n=2 Tax=Fopius arisanus TaxID=64838 RepID=A0A9R1UBM4_9HYME|nr:PREDICTED: uncharacterized protein LOC105273883 [Fopius arisanus]
MYLIPFVVGLIGYDQCVNDSPELWKYGPEYNFHFQVYASAVLEPDREMQSNVSALVKCRPFASKVSSEINDTLRCYVSSAEIDNYETDTSSTPPKTNRSHPPQPFEITGWTFDVLFGENAVEHIKIHNFFGNYRLNMYRDFISHLSFAFNSFGDKKERFTVRKYESSIMGECDTRFEISQQMKSPYGNMWNSTCQNLRLEVVGSHYSSLMLQKTRNVRNCRKHTSYLFGAEDSSNNNSVFSIQTNSSMSGIMLTPRSFESHTIRTGFMITRKSGHFENFPIFEKIGLQLVSIEPASTELETLETYGVTGIWADDLIIRSDDKNHVKDSDRSNRKMKTLSLIPFVVGLIGYDQCINESPELWKFGPEYKFGFNALESIQTKEANEVVVSNASAIVKCRPFSENSNGINNALRCNISFAELDQFEASASSTLAKGTRPSNPVPFDITGTIDILYGKAQIEEIRIHDPMENYQMNIYRDIASQLDVAFNEFGQFTGRLSARNYEKSTVGQCDTKFEVLKRLQNPKNTWESECKELRLSIHGTNDQSVMLEKTRNMENCTKRTPYFFGAEDFTAKSSVLKSYTNTSVSTITVAPQSFKSRTIRTGTLTITTSKEIRKFLIHEQISLRLLSIEPAATKFENLETYGLTTVLADSTILTPNDGVHAEIE